MASKLEQRRARAQELGYIDLAKEAEIKHGIPSGVLVGLLEQESGWFEDVIKGTRKSSAGAIGIAQFMEATAKDEGIDPLNVAQAINGAGEYLARLQKSTNSWTGALTAYNWGIGNYRKWTKGEKKTMPKEAREYAPGVMQRATNFGKLTVAPAAPAPDQTSNLSAPTQAPLNTTAQVAQAAAQAEAAPPAPNAPPQIAQATAAQQDPFANLLQQVQGTGAVDASLPPIPDAQAPALLRTPATDTGISGELIPQVSAPAVSAGSLIPEQAGATAAGAQLVPAATSAESLIPPEMQAGVTNMAGDKPFAMRDPKRPTVTIDTPDGPRQVQPENEEEETLVTELGQGNESGLLNLVPTLLGVRDKLASKPLINIKGDALDRLLGDIVKRVG